MDGSAPLVGVRGGVLMSLVYGGTGEHSTAISKVGDKNNLPGHKWQRDNRSTKALSPDTYPSAYCWVFVRSQGRRRRAVP